MTDFNFECHHFEMFTFPSVWDYIFNFPRNFICYGIFQRLYIYVRSKKITIKIRAHQIKRHKNANNDFDQSVVLEIKKKRWEKKPANGKNNERRPFERSNKTNFELLAWMHKLLATSQHHVMRKRSSVARGKHIYMR